MRDITPKHLQCAPGLSCPAVHEDGDDLLIIGTREHPQLHPDIPVGSGEEIVRIPRAFLANVILKKDHLAALRRCVAEDLI